MKTEVERELMSGEFIAEQFEAEASRLPASQEGLAESLRAMAKLHRESSSQRLVRLLRLVEE